MCLYTSSFKMNRFIKRVFIFFIPIILFSIAYEIIIRNIDNDYQYKNQWLTENSQTIELLAIGSSHCYCGIVPELLPIRSFNAGHSDQSIKYDYLIFNKFYDSMDSLKYLIVTISYGDPFYFVEDNINADYIQKNYAIYYDLPIDGYSNSFEILNGIDLSAIWNYYVKNIPLKLCSSLGNLQCPIESENNWQESATIRAQQLSIDSVSGTLEKKIYENYYSNISYMEKLINLCSTKNAKVILLTTPFHESFRQNINKEEWRLTIDFCNHLTQEFNNVSYINLFDDPRFSDEDFYNSDHLNTNGATKLTNILNEYIESLLTQ